MPFNYQKQPVKAKIDYPARSEDTDYQNLTGRPLLIMITATCYRASVAGSEAFLQGKVGDAPNPAGIASMVGQSPADNEFAKGIFHMAFMVPLEGYYRVKLNEAGAGSGVTINMWAEVEL